jgi:hypothetical protein
MTSKNRERGGLAAVVGVVVFGLIFGIHPASAAASVTPGWTFSVASQSGIPAFGTHYHDNHSGAFGNPPDKAEVGSLQDQAMSMEECRGLSEFDLTGLAPGTATLSFYVYQTGGLFPGQNDHPFTGNIAVLGYTGNNADDIADYSAPVTLLTTFSTSSLTVGTPLSFNVTSLYTSQLSGGSPSLGIRLQTTPSTVTGGGAFTFDNFTLTVTALPEPATALLVFVAPFIVLARRRRSRAS